VLKAKNLGDESSAKTRQNAGVRPEVRILKDLTAKPANKTKTSARCWCYGLQSILCLQYTILERLVSVKEKSEEFAMGRLLMKSGFINPYDRREISSSQSPQPRKASALRVVLWAGNLNAANRAPQHRHRRWDKGRMTTVPASGRSWAAGSGYDKNMLENCSFRDSFGDRAYHQIQEARVHRVWGTATGS